jgi:HEAT repeat protein
MSPKVLTANLLSVAIVVSHCAFFASHPRAQEKADLAKLSAQIRDKDAAVRQSAIEALGQLKDPAAIAFTA